MKKFYLLIIVIFSLQNVQSQNFFIQKSSFGVEGGYVRGTITADFNEAETAVSNGAYLGANAHFFIGEQFFIKPAVLFSYSQNTIWMHLPVMVKYYISNTISLVAGPQGSIIVGRKTPYNTFGFDFGAGAAFDFTDNLYIEARYNYEIPDSRLNNQEAPVSSRYNTIFVGIGYKFLNN